MQEMWFIFKGFSTYSGTKHALSFKVFGGFVISAQSASQSLLEQG